MSEVPLYLLGADVVDVGVDAAGRHNVPLCRDRLRARPHLPCGLGSTSKMSGLTKNKSLSLKRLGFTHGCLKFPVLRISEPLHLCLKNESC